MTHFIEVCEFAEVHAQCRCAAPHKDVRRVACDRPEEHDTTRVLWVGFGTALHLGRRVDGVWLTLCGRQGWLASVDQAQPDRVSCRHCLRHWAEVAS